MRKEAQERETFNGLGHLRNQKSLNGPVGVPVVHLPEPSSGHHERLLHVDEAVVVLVVGDLPLDLPAELHPARMDVLSEGPVIFVLSGTKMSNGQTVAFQDASASTDFVLLLV